MGTFEKLGILVIAVIVAAILGVAIMQWGGGEDQSTTVESSKPVVKDSTEETNWLAFLDYGVTWIIAGFLVFALANWRCRKDKVYDEHPCPSDWIVVPFHVVPQHGGMYLGIALVIRGIVLLRGHPDPSHWPILVLGAMSFWVLITGFETYKTLIRRLPEWPISIACGVFACLWAGTFIWLRCTLT